MLRLCLAQALVSWVPFARWRGTLGYGTQGEGQGGSLDLARRLAADVEWAAKRLPFTIKCLPRAMVLSWMLERRKFGHTLVIAVRPNQLRSTPDALHAWVEVEEERIIGDLPGPWLETLRIGS